MSCTEEFVLALQQENNKIKLDLIKQYDFCESLKNKLNIRDAEILRLSSLLEGGRPLHALNKECCYKEINAKITKLLEDNNKLANSKQELEFQLAEAIAKQHEAMKRALLLADRNKDLERELRDIDQMALAVEAECNCTLKENVNRTNKIQDELRKATVQIQHMEREILDVKRSRDMLESDYLTVRDEKDNFRRILENALDDKKRMTDRMNQFQKIEHDLNYEIDKLTQTCASQKRKISELEVQLVAIKFDGNINSNNGPLTEDVGTMTEMSGKCKCKAKKTQTDDPPPKDKETVLFDKVRTERNQLRSKCKCLQDQLDKINPLNKKPDTSYKLTESLKRELKTKEDKISKLEKDIHMITREKHELIHKLESVQDVKQWGEDIEASASLKSAFSRVEKERDMARSDIKRLEEERDALRKRLKQLTESHIAETEKLQKIITECEDKLRQLETERREIMTVQGSRRATINNLEDQNESLETQLRTTQMELDHMHTLYVQIKTLQEQTDSALADTQGQLTQVELEYAHVQDRVRELEKDRSELDKELSAYKNDLTVMKGNLATLDAERDNLMIEVDSKTERIASLEIDLNTKENKLHSLDALFAELKQKLSFCTDDSATKDYLLKTCAAEKASLKKELEECMKDKSITLKENRRLQEDFAKSSLEWKNAHSELERARREIDDLKTQLQQYVYEIKRAEDLISRKENERAEMLDQFRSLSQEATVLETSNHSLETQALEVKTQLSVATNHINDLEGKVEQLNILNRDYEKQISQLSSQIASLETQVRQSAGMNRKTELDLEDMKCLCVKLDEQKDGLIKDLKNKDDHRTHLEREQDHLKAEINNLRDSLHKETSNISSLENLLASSRQEAVEQRLINQELQSEVQRLKNMVQELQAKLQSFTTQSIEVVSDVKLHSGSTPNNISSIFTNIMAKRNPSDSFSSKSKSNKRRSQDNSSKSGFKSEDECNYELDDISYENTGKTSNKNHPNIESFCTYERFDPGCPVTILKKTSIPCAHEKIQGTIDYANIEGEPNNRCCSAQRKNIVTGPPQNRTRSRSPNINRKRNQTFSIILPVCSEQQQILHSVPKLHRSRSHERTNHRFVTASSAYKSHSHGYSDPRSGMASSSNKSRSQDYNERKTTNSLRAAVQPCRTCAAGCPKQKSAINTVNRGTQYKSRSRSRNRNKCTNDIHQTCLRHRPEFSEHKVEEIAECSFKNAPGIHETHYRTPGRKLLGIEKSCRCRTPECPEKRCTRHAFNSHKTTVSENPVNRSKNIVYAHQIHGRHHPEYSDRNNVMQGNNGIESQPNLPYNRGIRDCCANRIIHTVEPQQRYQNVTVSQPSCNTRPEYSEQRNIETQPCYHVSDDNRNGKNLEQHTVDFNTNATFTSTTPDASNSTLESPPTNNVIIIDCCAAKTFNSNDRPSNNLRNRTSASEYSEQKNKNVLINSAGSQRIPEYPDQNCSLPTFVAEFREDDNIIRQQSGNPCGSDLKIGYVSKSCQCCDCHQHPSTSAPNYTCVYSINKAKTSTLSNIDETQEGVEKKCNCCCSSCTC